MTTVEEFLAAANCDRRTPRVPPLRAPYNFVPLNAKVLESPWGQDGPDHAKPHAEGLCGALEVEWRVETPLLVGGTDNNSPFQLGAGGPYAIPGASLRGMVRSVLEILSYSHLEYYHDQRFGLRDYDAVTWQGVQKSSLGRPVPITKPNGEPGTAYLPFTGWLEKPKGSDTYQLTKCESVGVSIDDLCKALGLPTADHCSAWHVLPLHDRHARLDAAGLSGPINLGSVSPLRAGQCGKLVVAGLIKTEVERKKNPKIKETNKAKEVAFLEPPSGAPVTISEAAFKAFEAIQVKDGAQHPPPPVENWSFWQPKLAAGDPVPVFFRGEPATAVNRVPAPSEFVMALTRLMRVPHSMTTSDLVERTQGPALPRAKLDFVQALFGFVPPEEVNKKEPKGRQRAWRSRVRFGIATLAEGQQATPLDPRPAVTMKPRASFYPFYLRPKDKPNPNAAETVTHPVDWSSPDACLAGRKRYPPRNAARERLPVAPHEPGEQPNRELMNDLVFLQSTLDRPLVFRSTIRFHNLLPEELGGLLWAIGLKRPDGGETRRLRHMLGRAKGFGYGQVQAVVTNTAIEPNAGGNPHPLGDYAEKFETWVTQRLSRSDPFTALPEVAALLALCDADLGARLKEALRFTCDPEAGTPGDEAERILKAYSTLKKISACKPNNQHREWRGGQPIERDDPANQDFLILPEYPLK